MQPSHQQSRASSARRVLGALALAAVAFVPRSAHAQVTCPGLPLLLALPAATVEALHSINGDTPVNVCFNNLSSELVDVFWIDYGSGGPGTAVFYAALDPGQSYLQGTYFTHPWLITVDPDGHTLSFGDPLEGTPIEGFLPNRTDAEADITDVTGTPEPASVALMATGFMGLAGVGAARRKRNR